MISRPWHLWSAFALGLLIVFCALAWISQTAITIDQRNIEDQAARLRDEKLHVALWRMDAAMQTLITRESVRPHSSYRAFHPIGTTVDRSYNPNNDTSLLVPSPLLTERPEHIQLHFLFDGRGSVSSPQNPQGRFNSVAVDNFLPSSEVDNADSLLGTFAGRVDRNGLLQALPAHDDTAFDPRIPILSSGISLRLNPAGDRDERNRNEFQARQQQAQIVANARRGASNVGFENGLTQNAEHLSAMEGSLHALWVDECLLLARRVSVGNETLVEGCWLDWEALKASLLSQVSDLAPGADLIRDEIAKKDGTRHMASLPVRLVPQAFTYEKPAGLSGVQRAVFLAWGAIAIAALVVALVLRQAISLMERRGTFVSAVTHEMRTPLTTFRLYTDLLASGRMDDPEKTRRYVETLRSEAGRLSHLVENVLGYSRLERGRHPRQTEIQDTDALTEQTLARLELRARQSARPLRWLRPQSPLRFRADLTTVEQVLANLVDNACKYGTPAQDPTIEVRVRAIPGRVSLEVTDHGPGIPASAHRRLFRAFAKSATDAAHSAPGIGLGLAFSRRLARRMGGDLVHLPSENGCTFQLLLPRVEA